MIRGLGSHCMFEVSNTLGLPILSWICRSKATRPVLIFPSLEFWAPRFVHGSNRLDFTCHPWCDVIPNTVLITLKSLRLVLLFFVVAETPKFTMRTSKGDSTCHITQLGPGFLSSHAALAQWSFPGLRIGGSALDSSESSESLPSTTPKSNSLLAFRLRYRYLACRGNVQRWHFLPHYLRWRTVRIASGDKRPDNHQNEE